MSEFGSDSDDTYDSFPLANENDIELDITTFVNVEKEVEEIVRKKPKSIIGQKAENLLRAVRWCSIFLNIYKPVKQIRINFRSSSSMGQSVEDINETLKKQSYTDKVLASFAGYFEKIDGQTKARMLAAETDISKMLSKLDETHPVKTYMYLCLQNADIEHLLRERNNSIIPRLKAQREAVRVLEFQLDMVDYYINQQHPESAAIEHIRKFILDEQKRRIDEQARAMRASLSLLPTMHSHTTRPAMTYEQYQQTIQGMPPQMPKVKTIKEKEIRKL